MLSSKNRTVVFHASAVILLSSCVGETLIPLDMAYLPPERKVVSVKIEDYCPQSAKQYAGFFLSNRSARIDESELKTDYDRDGITDDKDNSQSLGIRHLEADTNRDGYSDLVMALTGITRNQQRLLPPCGRIGLDADQDGLGDCDELLVETISTNPDSDKDGIPDGIEVLYGLNPLNGNDADLDPDGDGISNGAEITQHTPIDEYNTPVISGLAYHYEAIPEVVGGDGKSCFDFIVSNIAIMSVSNGNALWLVWSEKDSSGNLSLQTASIYVPRSQEGGSVLSFRYPDLISRRQS